MQSYRNAMSCRAPPSVPGDHRACVAGWRHLRSCVTADASAADIGKVAGQHSAGTSWVSVDIEVTGHLMTTVQSDATAASSPKLW